MPRSAGLLTIMGSGETGPSMVAVHRRVFERFDEPPVVAVIDSAYGFQENADELSAKAVDYFQTSFPGVRAEVASLRRWDLPAGERERALEVIRSAEVVFAGPGSPSYALRVWEGLDVGGLLRAALDRGAVTVASAAAVTVGRHALPVYEIYKAGDDPSWLPGLDLLSAIGIETAVVPHFDNAEGGTHDTRFCWMGARRFAVLRGLLPAETVVLGIDEHSAALIDVAAGTLEAAGKGGVTILIGEHETVVSSGETIGLDRLAAAGSPSAGPAHAPAGEGDAEDVARFAEAFGEALDRGAVEPALDAILELEDAHEAWHDRAEEAHRALRGMVTRLGSVLTRQADIEDARIEAVHLLVDLRERARADGRWDDADALRTVLAVLGIEVRDTPSGPEWDDRRG